ncbi:hemerythrin domain-containing protein [Gilvimarinus agarilyticus]|uniref:hemerythrin domain-containing protein n=1 Tax=unclassified Gilvimarinus TaxID=2642066 RepID=UPI001C0A5D1D|nr:MULTISPECIES: hemerythrin domain-containing protein [unclassified Gilvimarinus]MBU2886698.1 hemerythrin domain-containing protein [Gilvimarinus agarilyticus]MDO6571365.1 hemerythrin domain-containing protein [Gilvimarinus sp. 2_MG-2023]MDO6746218.1 hemerythrin domain-containing protein [Gilvimarinus sp. 1_MG-2023]
MSIYSYLKKDHENIKNLMDRIKVLGADDSPERVKLFNQLKEVIIVHSKAEEKAFYDPLKDYSKTQDEVRHGENEHQETEKLLTDLTDSSLTGEAWFKKFLVLQESLEHHIEEEERDVFYDAKKVLDGGQAAFMEAAMRTEKQHQEADQTIVKRPNR